MKLRQAAFLLAFLIALSSCSGKPEGWISRKIVSSSLTCSHLTYPARNFYRNLEIHFQRDGEQVNVYLNIHSIPFKTDDEGMVLITIEIDECTVSYLAPALAGNQRLLLPEEAKELLLDALNGKHTVVIKAGKYSTELNSETFIETFQQFRSS